MGLKQFRQFGPASSMAGLKYLPVGWATGFYFDRMGTKFADDDIKQLSSVEARARTAQAC
jgi:hypothetical protein